MNAATWPQRFGPRGGTVCRHAQRGQAMTEFYIIMPVLLIMVLGIIQWAQVYNFRSLLQHATFMSARSGATGNGTMANLRLGLADGLTPHFLRVGGAATPGITDIAFARAQAQIAVTSPLAAITVLNPTNRAMGDFAVNMTDPAQPTRQIRAIPNDHLSYRPARVGGGSNQSIQDANLLKIEVRYCMRLIVPLIGKVVAEMWPTNPCLPIALPIDAALRNGSVTTNTGITVYPRIPVVATSTVRMQSPFTGN